MPPFEQCRIFISYARKDGAALARRLQASLGEKGFSAWLDTQRIAGGATWTGEIEIALDEAEYVLALLTPASYISEICRAEQLRSLRKGKCVIPLLAHRGSDIPLHLETKNYRDFTAESNYTKAFDELLGDLKKRNGVKLKMQFRRTYVTAPPLPVNFVERPQELASLRDVLITDDGGRHIALTALQGMGGIGKTVLAQALCHDSVVQDAFPDGVIWITIGKESTFDALTRMREVGKALDDDLSRYDNELGARNQYRSTIRNKATLIVVDDVWNSRDLEPLLAESSPRSRLLFTTRDSGIVAAVGAREHVADLLSQAQSREVLARWAGMEVLSLPPLAEDLIAECGKLPLALSMVGAMLRGKPSAFWKTVLGHLRHADLDKIKAQFPDYLHPNLLKTIGVSVEALDARARERYLALAVMLEEMATPVPIQQCLWTVDESEASETSERFISLSLAQRDQPEGSIRLHDLQLDYIRAQFRDKKALELIHEALRLSSNVIVKDPGQFASQMVARLLPFRDVSAVSEFSEHVGEGTRTAWLRSLSPTLHPPGTPLTRTLVGHTGDFSGVALSRDGRIAVSASNNRTLKVWDLSSGGELLTLAGHSHAVNGVALSGDGQIAVSASEDSTLKVWDMSSGRELRTLIGHHRGVNGVALSGNERIAVSASWDHMLKVWDVSSGRELCTLPGHGGIVWAVALSGDGRIAVSASDDRTLKVWEVDSGREVCTLTGHSGGVRGVALSEEGRMAVSASDDRTLKVWEVGSGRELHTLVGHSRGVYGVAVSADGRIAVSASWDQVLKVWELSSGRELRTLIGHSGGVVGVAVSADGRIAVSASNDRTLKVWQLGSGPELPTMVGHTRAVFGVAVSGDGRIAGSASSDHTLKVWELSSGREVCTLAGHTDSVRDVALSEDGRIAVSASSDHTLKVWELSSGRELRNVAGHSGIVYGVAVSGDGRIAVSASEDRTLKVWDLVSGCELRTLAGHTQAVYGVALSGDGRMAVSASWDQTLKVWDVNGGCELRTLAGHDSAVYGVALSRDARIAVSASSDRTLKVWDLSSGRELRTLAGHSGGIWGVSLNEDEKMAISTSDDRMLKVWNLESGELLATFTCDGFAYCCAFSDALKLIVAGDAGGHVHFLHLEEPKPKP